MEKQKGQRLKGKGRGTKLCWEAEEKEKKGAEVRGKTKGLRKKGERDLRQSDQPEKSP